MHTRSVMARCLVAVTILALWGSPASAVRQDVADPGADVFSGKKRTVALGVSMWEGRQLEKLDAFTASIRGRAPATWTIWSYWGRPDMRLFPTEAAEGARARGATPMIWWEPYDPLDPSDTTYSRLSRISAGRHDDYIRRFARDAKRFGGRVLLRPIPQANSDYLPWAWDYSQSDDNTIDSFRRAWRHVHGIFRDVGARNVKFVWSVATQRCAGDCLTRPLGYPGDKYVDYLGFTWENWGDPGQPWIPMLDGFRPVNRALSAVSSKPIMAVATASGPQGGDKEAWIRQGYPAVYANLPRIVAIMWLNIDLSGPPHHDRDWSLSGGPLAAYAAIAAMPEFQGRIP